MHRRIARRGGLPSPSRTMIGNMISAVAGSVPSCMTHRPYHFYPRRPRKRSRGPRKRLRGPRKQPPGHRLELSGHHREVPRRRKLPPRHRPRTPRHHFNVRRGRFAHQLEHRETTSDALKARRDRWGMMPIHLALTASRARTTPQRLNPIEGHMRATRHGSTPRAAQTIATLDHFAQRTGNAKSSRVT
jgi:hypothetical protein